MQETFYDFGLVQGADTDSIVFAPLLVWFATQGHSNYLAWRDLEQ
jgi:hypothetical protein